MVSPSFSAMRNSVLSSSFAVLCVNWIAADTPPLALNVGGVMTTAATRGLLAIIQTRPQRGSPMPAACSG